MAWACYTDAQSSVTVAVLLQALPNVGTNDFFARFTYRVGGSSHLVISTCLTVSVYAPCSICSSCHSWIETELLLLCSPRRWNSDLTECLCKPHSLLVQLLNSQVLADSSMQWSVQGLNPSNRLMPLRRYCVCELPYNPDAFMIMCSKCEEWYAPGQPGNAVCKSFSFQT